MIAGADTLELHSILHSTQTSRIGHVRGALDLREEIVNKWADRRHKCDPMATHLLSLYPLQAKPF